MARALAIETSGRVGSAAVLEAGVVLGEERFEHGLKHAAELVPRIDGMLRGLGWGPQDLQWVYVSAGPGSFTGLRIGVTLAKTLALATGAKVIAVPTVQVLAHNAPPEAQNVIIVLDAKRDQIFTARLTRDTSGRWQSAEDARLDSLPAMLARSPRPVHLIGEGIPYHEKFLPTDDAGVIVTAPEIWQAQARVVAEVGAGMAARGELSDIDRLTPIYIRRPEAEERWSEGRGIGKVVE